MGIYTFTLEQFHIDNTRSRHEDTNTVQFRLAVGEPISVRQLMN
ncbi:hypothetical protein NONI108955_38590 [Nocardia ninae]|nr:hypothetical protein [Nocardia ninae]